MGAGHQKQRFNAQVFENPRLNKNIIKRKIFDGIDSPQLVLNLWLNLTDFYIFPTHSGLKSHPDYHNFSEKSCSCAEMIKKDIPRTFPDEKHLQTHQNQSLLQRVLVALSNRFPEVGYISGMSFYVQRVLQIAPQEKAFHILAWLYRNDSVIYNIASAKQSIHTFIEVVNEMVNKQCPKLGAVLKHINVSIGAFSVTWIRSFFSLVCDKTMFCTIFSLALLEGSKVWVLATIALIKCLQKPIMKSNRSDEKFLEITSLRNLLPDLQTQHKFLQFLQKMVDKYQHQIDGDLRKLTSIVPLDQQCESKHQEIQ